MADKFDDILEQLHGGATEGNTLSDTDYSNPIAITDKREFDIPPNYNTIIAYAGDVNSQIVTFEIPRYQDGHDLGACAYKKLIWKNLTSGYEGASDLIINVETNKLKGSWEVPAAALTHAGQLEIAISIYDVFNGKIAFSWNTTSSTAFSVGSTLSDLDYSGQDFYIPAKDEILYINENRQITMPNGYNPIIANYGDIGTSKAYFRVKRNIAGIDVLDDNTSISVLINFNDCTTSESIGSGQRKSFVESVGDEYVILEWNVSGAITNNNDFYFGPVTIGLSFSTATLKWSTLPFSGLLINEALVEGDETREERIPFLAQTLDGNEIDKAPTVAAVNTGLDELDGRIARNNKHVTSIEKSLPPESFEVDSTVAYKKDIPEKALPYAKISKIGGMTRKCTNLIPFPYENSSKTLRGITYTVNGDGSIHIKGTCTAQSDFLVQYNTPLTLPAGTYVISGNNGSIGVLYAYIEGIGIVYSTGNGTSFTLTKETPVRIAISVYEGETVDKTIYPMVNEGTTALPYEPYFEGLRSASVTAMESVGVNLIDLKDMPIAGSNRFDVPITVTEGKYWLSIFNSDGTGDGWKRGTTYAARFMHDEENIVLGVDYGGVVTKEQAAQINKFRIFIAPDYYTGTSSTFTAMLNKGETHAPLIPHFKRTIPIPEAVQPENGINNEVYDYLDFGEQESVKRVGVVDMGTLNWGYGNYFGTDTKCFYSTDISGAKLHNAYVAPTAICHLYNPTTANEIAQRGTQGYALFADTGSLIICDNNYTDAASFKAAMQGVMLVYELATPIVTDVSDILTSDNFIEVEGGGTITAVNENNLAVPSEIVYRIKMEALAQNLSGNEEKVAPSVKAVNEGLALKAEKTDVDALKRADDALDARVKDLEFINGMMYTTQTGSFSALPISVPEGILQYTMINKISDIQVGAPTKNGRVKNHEIYDQWGATFTVSEEKDSTYTAIHISAPEGSDDIYFELGFDTKSVAAGERIFISVWIDKNSVSIPEMRNGKSLYIGDFDFSTIDLFAGQRVTYMYTATGRGKNISDLAFNFSPKNINDAVDFTVKVGISKQLCGYTETYNFDPTPAGVASVNEAGTISMPYDELANVRDASVKIDEMYYWGGNLGCVYDYNNKSMIYNYADYDTGEYVCRLVQKEDDPIRGYRGEVFLLDEEIRIPFQEYNTNDGRPYREMRIYDADKITFTPLDFIGTNYGAIAMRFPIYFEWTYVKERGV